MSLFTQIRNFSTGALVGLPAPGMRQAAERLATHPKEIAPSYVLAHDSATPLDELAFGSDLAQSRALRNTGRIAGLAVGAYFGGEFALGAGEGAAAGSPEELGLAGDVSVPASSATELGGGADLLAGPGSDVAPAAGEATGSSSGGLRGILRDVQTGVSGLTTLRTLQALARGGRQPAPGGVQLVPIGTAATPAGGTLVTTRPPAAPRQAGGVGAVLLAALPVALYALR